MAGTAIFLNLDMDMDDGYGERRRLIEEEPPWYAPDKVGASLAYPGGQFFAREVLKWPIP
jgi:hypothetical protein